MAKTSFHLDLQKAIEKSEMLRKRVYRIVNETSLLENKKTFLSPTSTLSRRLNKKQQKFKEILFFNYALEAYYIYWYKCIYTQREIHRCWAGVAIHHMYSLRQTKKKTEKLVWNKKISNCFFHVLAPIILQFTKYNPHMNNIKQWSR